MSLFKRLFTIGKAEANAVADKLEDPIKMTEQGIRDMKKDLEDSLKALAEVKALEIRSKNEITKETQIALDYEKKAVLLLQKAANGQIASDEADRLASQALQKKSASEEQVERISKEQLLFSQNVTKLEHTVKELKNNINSWENELKTLKARVKVASATKNLNKQISAIDSSNTISLLEKMKEKVAEEEALSEAYGTIANTGKSIDDEINDVLKDGTESKVSDSLAALKAKINTNKKDT
ncbi:PspA/IM30 family protein [Aquimarina sp. RZ0]|uniref:PspA/IM30 family protein n=1 Tax=Aquimarina sp. RZ0 TaxID=2607730 RepID=UPI0011F3BCF6|nr:PspA/IM30 family protein [Aquimarina sp. RZ0]KAA1248020.1 PspA/IM30 family protein [Aquimarina sp. RZ0]